MCSCGLKSKLSQINFSLIFVPTADTISSYSKEVALPHTTFRTPRTLRKMGRNLNRLKYGERLGIIAIFVCVKQPIPAIKKILHCHNNKRAVPQNTKRYNKKITSRIFFYSALSELSNSDLTNLVV